MTTAKPKSHRDLTAPQRYMLSLLNLDGELLIQRGFKLVRPNGAQAGFQTSAKALVYHGLARYSDNFARLLSTAEGRKFFRQDTETPEKTDLESREP